MRVVLDKNILNLISKKIAYSDAKLELKKKLKSKSNLSALSILDDKIAEIPHIKSDKIF